MPKLPDRQPEGTSARRHVGALGVVLLAASAAAGLYLWWQSGDVPVAGEGSRQNLAAGESFGAHESGDSLPGLDNEAPANTARPGSMQENLLNTTDADRNQLFRRAIADVGFDCSDVRDASAVGSGGSAWRTNCGNTNLYFIEVGEYGRFTVVPMRFDDGLTPRIPVVEFKERE
jgi:hypothetical protein